MKLAISFMSVVSQKSIFLQNILIANLYLLLQFFWKNWVYKSKNQLWEILIWEIYEISHFFFICSFLKINIFTKYSDCQSISYIEVLLKKTEFINLFSFIFSPSKGPPIDFQNLWLHIIQQPLGVCYININLQANLILLMLNTFLAGICFPSFQLIRIKNNYHSTVKTSCCLSHKHFISLLYVFEQNTP